MSLYNFCGRCGSDQMNLDNLSMYLCKSCGLETYLNPKPTSNIIFYCEDKVLIAQRARDPGLGTWGLPGGFMGNGESFEECTQREVLEELGIRSINPKYFCSIYSPQYIYKDENYPTICVILHEPITTEQYNRIKPADDVADVKLITRDEIANFEFCFDIDQLLLRFFDRISD